MKRFAIDYRPRTAKARLDYHRMLLEMVQISEVFYTGTEDTTAPRTGRAMSTEEAFLRIVNAQIEFAERQLVDAAEEVSSSWKNQREPVNPPPA